MAEDASITQLEFDALRSTLMEVERQIGRLRPSPTRKLLEQVRQVLLVRIGGSPASVLGTAAKARKEAPDAAPPGR
jgi:hypothetical protein